jgi:hypothetical protein
MWNTPIAGDQRICRAPVQCIVALLKVSMGRLFEELGDLRRHHLFKRYPPLASFRQSKTIGF